MKLVKLIRWKYVLTRLAVIAVIALACRFCLDGALRWAIIASGEASLGAKVEIDDLTTSLADGEIILTGVAAANPRKPMTNAAAAEQARLKIDVAALLHKQLVVTDGVMVGLEFGSPRRTSGALEGSSADDEASASSLDPLVDAAGAHGAAWLDNLAARLEGDVTESLQTPRVARELQARWPAEYESLKQRVAAIKTQGKEIEASYKQVRSNPLRSAAGLSKLQSQLAAADQQLAELSQRINTLPDQVAADRQAIEAARANDEQFIKQSLNIDEIDGEQLSQYLLESETSGYLATAVHWIKQLRAMAPERVDVEESRSRGVNVLFVDRLPPKWLIQRIQLAGSATVNGAPLRLLGALTDASSDQRLHGKPLRLALTGSGALDCRLQVEMNRLGEQPRDSLQFECPRLPLPERTMGKAEKLAVQLAPSEARLQAEITLVGEQLDGLISVAQKDIRASASLGVVRDELLTQALASSLESLQDISATVDLSGTLDSPQWKLHSNLGPQLAAGLKTALTGYVQQRAERALAKTRAQVDAQLAELAAKRDAAQQELLGQLGDQQQVLAQLAPLLGGSSGGFSLPQLGNLPLGKLRK